MIPITQVALQLVGSLIAALAAYVLYKIVTLTYFEFTSPLRELPGPKSPSWIYGHFRQVWDLVSSVYLKVSV
jgi:uncharacterized membrane protein YagU involved in acid resistance